MCANIHLFNLLNWEASFETQKGSCPANTPSCLPAPSGPLFTKQLTKERKGRAHYPLPWLWWSISQHRSALGSNAISILCQQWVWQILLRYLGVQILSWAELNSPITCMSVNVCLDFSWVISDVFSSIYLGTGTVFSFTLLNLNLKELKVSFIFKLD